MAAWGLAGGSASAPFGLAPPLALGAAHLRTEPANTWHLGVFLFVMSMLFLGAAGEEILFRGYGFQVLVRSAGPLATILPAGVVFGAVHASTPPVSRLCVG